MEAVHQLAPTVGIESACEVLGVARASFYRQPVFGPALPVASRPSPARALSKEERETVRAVLNSTRFQDCAPAAIQATLLDAGQYLCSTRTMYRFLEQDGDRGQLRDPQTSRRPTLVEASSAVSRPLHAYQRFLAEYGGALLSGPYRQPPPAWRFSRRVGTGQRHRRLRRSSQRKSQALHLDRIRQ